MSQSGNPARKSNINNDAHCSRMYHLRIDQKNSLKSEWARLSWSNIDQMFLQQKPRGFREEYFFYVPPLTNSAEWKSIWMIKVGKSANGQRENLPSETLIRAETKRPKYPKFCPFCPRARLESFSVWKKARRIDLRRDLWQIPTKTTIGQLISYQPPGVITFTSTF